MTWWISIRLSSGVAKKLQFPETEMPSMATGVNSSVGLVWRYLLDASAGSVRLAYRAQFLRRAAMAGAAWSWACLGSSPAISAVR